MTSQRPHHDIMVHAHVLLAVLRDELEHEARSHGLALAPQRHASQSRCELKAVNNDPVLKLNVHNRTCPLCEDFGMLLDNGPVGRIDLIRVVIG